MLADILPRLFLTQGLTLVLLFFAAVNQWPRVEDAPEWALQGLTWGAMITTATGIITAYVLLWAW